MIACRILVQAPYADYQGSGTNRKVRVHSVGDIVLFPHDYAEWLKNANMVEIVTEAANQDLEVEEIEINESEEVEIVPTTDTPLASDSAVEFAADNEIDLKTVTGTGSKGRILLTDVRNVVDG